MSKQTIPSPPTALASISRHLKELAKVLEAKKAYDMHNFENECDFLKMAIQERKNELDTNERRDKPETTWWKMPDNKWGHPGIEIHATDGEETIFFARQYPCYDRMHFSLEELEFFMSVLPEAVQLAKKVKS